MTRDREFMKCPYCAFCESKVTDSRPADDGEKIRRRRECLQCEKRFTTYEIVETMAVVVVKKDKSRQAFDREKLLRGLMRACDKRQISIHTLESLVDEIQTELQNSLDKEISSSRVGEMAMSGLKNIDEVAYVRFASVYHQFKDVSSFLDELERILGGRSS